LDLPIAKARPAIKTYAGGVIRRSISSGTSHAFKAMIHEQGATLFMGLLAAVNTLLYKYSDQTDIITGTSIAGREHIDLENQIGYYLNTLALRVQLEGQHSYLALLETVKRVTLGAYEHQVYPFEELVDALQLKRDPSRNNLFDVFVVMRNINVTNQHKRKEGLSGMIVSEYKDAEQQVSKFDLTFGFFEVGSELFLDLEYNSDLYDRAMASRITDDLEKIMHAVVGQPLAAIRELDLPLPVEKKRSMIGFNDKVESLFNSPISTEF
jgi:non-ribosomal peptide synthetase component F